MTRHRRNQFDRPVAAGFSLVELMIAMTLLALASVVGLQIMQLSETSFTQGRTQLNIQQKNQAISAFIKDDFKNETLGDLAFDTGTGFHFYDFYKATKSPYGYSDAFTETAKLPDSKCGLKPYVATITSAEEQDFIQQKMHYSSVHKGWESGWIGGSASPTNGWAWDSGPEAGQKFWQGGPFDYGIRKSDDAELRVTSVAPEQVDPLYSTVPDRVAFRRKKNVWSNPLDEFHYNNFSYGLLGSDTCNDPKNLGYCQPLQSRFQTRLGTVGGPGQGLWFAMSDNLYPCRGKWLFSICGHYFEWGGMSNDPDITIANRVAVDVATHREYCQLE